MYPRPGRHSTRLRGYDYAAVGGYFVTICTFERQCVLGNITEAGVALSLFGKIVQEEWFASARLRREIELDAFVIMPNHVHGVLFLLGQPPLPPEGPQRRPRSLSTFVSGFKSACSRRINALRGTPAGPVWQRNFHDRIVRNQDELQAIRRYIEENPLRWAVDSENPALNP